MAWERRERVTTKRSFKSKFKPHTYNLEILSLIEDCLLLILCLTLYRQYTFQPCNRGLNREKRMVAYKCIYIYSHTSFQLGRPAWVRVDSPVIRSFLSRRCMMLSAIWSPAPRMSVLALAAVMYSSMSITFSTARPSSKLTSICSFSILFRSPTNHSKLFWSRLIQMKFTCETRQKKNRLRK